MDQSERRVIGSLLLLSGLTFLIIGLHTGQLTMALQIVKEPLIPEEGVAPPPTPPPSPAKEVIVNGFEWGFSPSTITVNKGDKVRLTFRNTGAAMHNLKIDELGVFSGNIGPGGSTVVDFTADKTGTFAYYCSIPGHREAGMEGQITIQT